MNGKTAKLIRKFALASGSEYRGAKALYRSLPRNLRHSFKQEIREFLAKS